MNWIILAFLAPTFWALANYVDKFVIGKYLKSSTTGAGSLVVFTGLTASLIALLIGIIHGDVFIISLKQTAAIAFAGALLVASFIPYLKALQNEDSSVVVPLFQLIPVFSYFLAFIFLGEQLSAIQILAGIIVIVGSVGISLDLDKKFSIKRKVFLLMGLSSLMIAVNSLIFKMVALNTNFWVTGFWEYVGAGIFALMLIICVKTYRKEFLSLVGENGLAVSSLNIGGEVLNLSAKLSVAFATLSTPIALIWIINGLQPFIILVLGIIINLTIPHLIKESAERKHLVQRGVCSVIIFIGIYLLFI